MNWSEFITGFLGIIGNTHGVRPEIFQDIINRLHERLGTTFMSSNPFNPMDREFAQIIDAESIDMAQILGRTELGELENARYQRVWPIYQDTFLRTCEVARQNFENINAPVLQKYGMFRFMLELVVNYGQPENYQRIREEYSNAFRANAETPNEYPDKVQLPNVPALKSLMPHQNRVLAQLGETEGAAIVGVDAGGGKTLIIISDCLSLLAQGKIQRPIVICPNNIVPEWVREINTVSKGKLNAFPLNTRIYNRLTRNGMLTDEQISETIAALPINSIVITDFSFLRSKSELIDYLGVSTHKYPRIEMLHKVGFDYVAVDESHNIKKQKAQATQTVYLLSAYAKYLRLVSGTIISDKPSDLVGQYGAINPVILGDKERFDKTYKRGRGWDPEVANRVERRLRPFARGITVKRHEWSFLLPRIKEEFHTVIMTDNQRQFYQDLFHEVLNRIRSDPKLLSAMQEGGEEKAEEIEAALQTYLAKLEMFINAPDENEAFRNLSNLRPEDLISAKLSKVDDIIEQHLRKGFLEENNNKIIVFGYNKVVSKHIYKHSKHASAAVHYHAGDLDQIDRFRNDPKVRILIADENSLKEGLNLQVASMMIRLQTLWSPGNQEQALARIFRPDPRGRYNRTEVDFHWIITDMTLEVAKTARLISKIITKAKFDEQNNQSFFNEVVTQVEDLPLISMSLSVIEDYDSIQDLTGESGLGNFFGSYSTFKAWEDRTFEASRRKLKEQIELRRGPIKEDQIKEYAMIPLDGSAELPNSKGSFEPWVKNVTPTDFPDFKLVPIMTLEEENTDAEDDDEQGTIVSEINVVKGDMVITEFGPGYIRGMSKRSLSVDIPGFGRKIKIPKYNAYVGSDQKKMQELAKRLRQAGPKGLPKMAIKGAQLPDIMDLPGKKRSKKIKPEDVSKPDVAKGIHLHVFLINGVVTLLTQADDQDAAKEMPKLGYRYIEEAYYQTMKTYRAFGRYLDKARELHQSKQIMIEKPYWKELDRIKELYRTNKRNLGLIKKSGFKQIQRNFLYVAQHKKPKNKKIVRPYVLVWDGELTILYNAATQNRSLLTKSFNGVQGVTKISSDTIMAPSYVKMLERKSAIKAELKAIKERGLVIQNRQQFEEELKTLR